MQKCAPDKRHCNKIAGRTPLARTAATTRDTTHTRKITVTFRAFRSAYVASHTMSSKLPFALAPMLGLSNVTDDPGHGTARTHHPAREPQHKE